MGRYLRLSPVVEAAIEFYIMNHLRIGNEHLYDELTYDHKIVIHSIEVIDDDLVVANVEHMLYDNVLSRWCQPMFTKIELTRCWPAEPEIIVFQ